jgi:hypothetical protein
MSALALTSSGSGALRRVCHVTSITAQGLRSLTYHTRAHCTVLYSVSGCVVLKRTGRPG